MANNRICKVCKTEYKYCPNCDNDRFKPSWYSMFHSELCKEIFDVLVENTLGKITDAQAKEVLLKLDLSNKDNFDEDIKNQIDNIIGNDEDVSKNISKNEIDITVESKITEEFKNEIVTEDTASAKSFSKKRRTK